MAPKCLLNQMKTPIQMIIFTPKCLHLHSIHLFNKELSSNHFVPSSIYALWEIIRHMTSSLPLWILTINVKRQNMPMLNIFIAKRGCIRLSTHRSEWKIQGLLGANGSMWGFLSFMRHEPGLAPRRCGTARLPGEALISRVRISILSIQRLMWTACLE